MKKNNYKVTCPKCSTVIDVSEILIHQLKEQVEAEQELKLSEKNQMIEGLRLQLKGMQKKIEQSSQQAQGEVMELLIQDFLAKTYPLDLIKEVPKGVRGADCIQYINTRERENIGSILFEIKRTKSWSAAWIPKFKEDIQSTGSIFGIIVTEIMPNNQPTMCQIDGIWVCTVHEVKALSAVLREAVILYSNALFSQANADGKLQQLYDYLTSNDFTIRVKGIIESFVELESELTKEKRAMEAIWKRREATIKKIIKNSSHLYGSVKSIVGSAVGTIEILELNNSQNPAE